MAYHFDDYGWYAGQVADGSPRSTLLIPANTSQTTTPGELRANFTGYVWVDLPYAAPAPSPEPEPLPRHVTPLAFRNRFTLQEKVAYEMAALDNPAADAQVRYAAAGLRAALSDVLAAKFIDLDKTDTRQRVQSLESIGVLAQGRALEILDAEIQPNELP